ncbi:MAG: two pore domain potassium channel family protein [Phycisphaerales bacterium]|nr:two pore domain potassium channel family protein [Phycisphaerales bacterium]
MSEIAEASIGLAACDYYQGLPCGPSPRCSSYIRSGSARQLRAIEFGLVHVVARRVILAEYPHRELQVTPEGGFMQTIATKILRRRVQCHAAKGARARFGIWRDLNVLWTSNSNPVDVVVQSNVLVQPMSLTQLGTDYFPGGQLNVEVNHSSQSTGVTLDAMNGIADESVEHAREYLRTGSGDGKVPLQMLSSLCLNAVHALLAHGMASHGLRMFLNHYRLMSAKDKILGEAGSHDRLDAMSRLLFADILVDLREFALAGQQYIQAAEEFVQNNALLDGADAFERAGLAWKAIERPDSRQTLTLGVHEAVREYDLAECFRRAKTTYGLAGDYDSVSRAFILERDSQMRWSTSKWRRIELRCMRSLWLYGESPLHAVRAIFLTWLLFAVLFLFSGFRSGANDVNYDLVWELSWSSANDNAAALYFSAVTLTTLGYGDYSPSSPVSMFLAGCEAFLGIFLSAMLLVSIQRRYVGR